MTRSFPTFLFYWFLLNFFNVYSLSTVKTNQRHYNHKRQVSLDDLVQTTLQLVRPIIDTPARMLKENPATLKKISVNDQLGPRELDILGAPLSQSSDLSMCRENSQICKFIFCTAHNFKTDQSLANLNLAAQLLGDKKLRKVFSRNPETITSVCRESSLDQNQCRLFSKAFQLIDQLMTGIEDPIEKSQTIEGTTSVEKNSEDRIPLTIKNPSTTDLTEFDPNLLLNDAESSTVYISPKLTNPIKPQKSNIGSRTWSIHSPSNSALGTGFEHNNAIGSGEVRASPNVVRNIDTRLKILNYSSGEQLESIQTSSSDLSRPPFAKSMNRVFHPGAQAISTRASISKPVEVVPIIVTRPSPTTTTTTRKTGIPEADEFADEYSYEDDVDEEESSTASRLLAIHGRRKREKPSTDYYDMAREEHSENNHNTRNNSVDAEFLALKEKNGFGQMDCLHYLG